MSYWQKVTYSSTSMTLSCNKGYKIAENSVNMTTFSHGRKTYKICNYPYAKQFFRFPWKFEDSRVVKHMMVIIISILLYPENFQTRK